MGKLKQKAHDARIMLRYYVSSLYKAWTYTKLLQAVNEVQKFGDAGCFDNYPEINVHCGRFKEECGCAGKTCPMFAINKQYIDAKKRFEDARVAHYQAETAMFCVKVKE